MLEELMTARLRAGRWLRLRDLPKRQMKKSADGWPAWRIFANYKQWALLHPHSPICECLPTLHTHRAISTSTEAYSSGKPHDQVLSYPLIFATRISKPPGGEGAQLHPRVFTARGAQCKEYEYIQ